MGDVRYHRAYDAVARALDRQRAIRDLSDEDVVQALAAASRTAEPLLANVLATEALNRVRRLRAALANLGEGVVAMDCEGIVRWVNPAAERLLGWSRGEVVGTDFDATVKHADGDGHAIPRERCSILRVVDSRQVATGHGERFCTRSGGMLAVAYTSAPLLAADGEAEGIVLAVQDYTQRELAERELREREERYQSLFDHFPMPVVSVTPTGRIVDANASAESLAGVSAEAARGRSFDDFVREEDLPRVRAAFGRVLEGGCERETFHLRRGDGAEIPVHVAAVPVVLNGVAVGVHVIVQASDAP